jgi:hypothetical protein
MICTKIFLGLVPSIVMLLTDCSHFKKFYRNELNKLKRKACKEYIENSSNKCKAAWNIVTQEHTPFRTRHVEIDPEQLKSYFLHPKEVLKRQIPTPNCITQASSLAGAAMDVPTFNWTTITPQQVIKVVSQPSNSKTMDYYWFSNFILKQINHIIADPLAFIFTECLREGYFSNYVKISKVVPIFKKGDKNLPQNYRPISIIPVVSKNFESLIYLQISNHFNTLNLLVDY